MLKSIKNYYRCRKDKFNLALEKSKKYAFIFLAADYNNLGDIAITIAQHRFLEETMPEYEIVEIYRKQTYGAIRAIKKLDAQNVLVTLIGGGNNGTLYEFLEEPRRCILYELKNFRIVSFPQTVIYENTERGRPYYRAFVKACKKCKDLTLVAREQYSYDVYQRILPGHVLLTPDIVFSLQYKGETCNREEWVALIMRDDKEKKIDGDFHNALLTYIDERYDVCYMDTCDIDITEGRDIVLTDYLNRLCKAKFSVTDRLHGMILSYITGTPCYVLENNNPKIKSTFETWLLKNNYIQLFDATNLDEFVFERACNVRIDSFYHLFDPLRKEIESITHKEM